MGKNNRTRRAAKAKHRAHDHDRRNARRPSGARSNDLPPSGEPLLTTPELIEALLGVASAPSPADADLARRAFGELCVLDRAVVRRECERQLLVMIGAAWTGGWQPVELARQVRRTTDAGATRLVTVAIAGDHARRGAATLDPRWIAQLDRLDPPRVTASTGWLDGWAEDDHVPWPEVIGAAVALSGCLAALTRLPILIPPPGARAPRSAPVDLTSATIDPMLDRVRALLAQAESTTFEAEAEAFTAKAQELMTRHAIDLAMVAASADRSEQPITIRVPIDDPYIDAKSLLLQGVADHSRCRSVFHQRVAMSSVTGFVGDVAATEMLFTSLLVQAQTAMHAAAAASPAGSRARSRSFRSAFLVAYARRIAERLADVNTEVVSQVQAETSRSILPVLAARSSAVDAVVEEMFGELSSTEVKGGYDAAGWASGHLAADRAQLAFGDLAAGGRGGSVPHARISGG